MDRLLIDGGAALRTRALDGGFAGSALVVSAAFADLREHRDDIATTLGTTLCHWQDRDRDFMP